MTLCDCLIVSYGFALVLGVLGVFTRSFISSSQHKVHSVISSVHSAIRCSNMYILRRNIYSIHSLLKFPNLHVHSSFLFVRRGQICYFLICLSFMRAFIMFCIPFPSIGRANHPCSLFFCMKWLQLSHLKRNKVTV